GLPALAQRPRPSPRRAGRPAPRTRPHPQRTPATLGPTETQSSMTGPVNVHGQRTSKSFDSAAGSEVPPETDLAGLQDGPRFRFADWPSDQVPRRSAGAYTIWREDRLLYAGMSGRGARAEDFVTILDNDRRDKAKGLITGLLPAHDRARWAASA